MTLHQANSKVTAEDLARVAPGAPALPSGMVSEILTAWESVGRHYHTTEHLLEIAGWYQVIAEGPGWRQPLEVWLAVLFHDAVYEVGSSDNESRSAALAVSSISSRALKADTSRVQQLIEWTALHGRALDLYDDPDAAMFLDCDMVILASPPERYRRYEAQVRQEWLPVVGQQAFDAGRARFIDTLCAMPHRFHSDWFRKRFESRALVNLQTARRTLDP